MPAGTPLNSWFEFLSFSPEAYIRSGYCAAPPRVAACCNTLPVYGRLTEIAFENYECTGRDEVVGELRPLKPIGRKGMERLRVTMRLRDGSAREAKVEWNDRVSDFLHGDSPFGEADRILWAYP